MFDHCQSVMQGLRDRTLSVSAAAGPGRGLPDDSLDDGDGPSLVRHWDPALMNVERDARVQHCVTHRLAHTAKSWSPGRLVFQKGHSFSLANCGSWGGALKSHLGCQADYLEFGRLLGEKPEDVERGLKEAGFLAAQDDRAQQYLQE